LVQASGGGINKRKDLTGKIPLGHQEEKGVFAKKEGEGKNGGEREKGAHSQKNEVSDR